MDIVKFLSEHPDLMLEAEQAINLSEELTIACKCHCGSRGGSPDVTKK